MDIKNVFTQVFILFILILVGYIATKKNLIDSSLTKKLSKLIMNIFLPCMIINSMQLEYSPTILKKVLLLILISLLIYAISFLIAIIFKAISKSKNDIGVYQFAILFSNVGFMGYPIVEAILGKDAIFYAAIFNIPFNLLIMTLGVFVICKENNNYSFSFKSLINPVIISIFIGLSLFILNIKLPYIINRPIELLGNITTPLSMIVIGSMLCLSSISECVRNKKLYIVSFIRLILMPILIYFILKGIVYDKLLFSIPIVIVSMPVASNTAILSSEYNANDKLASQLVFMSTLFSILTIPIISSILLI